MVLKRADEYSKGKKDEYLYFSTLEKRIYKTGVSEVVEIKCDECGNKVFYLRKLSPRHKAVAVCTECSKIVQLV